MLQVVNSTALGEAIRDAIACDYGGTLSKAAEAVGLSQPTLYRLANPSPAPLVGPEKRRSIRVEMGDSLAKLLGPRMDPDTFFLPQQARSALESYGKWLDEMERQIIGDGSFKPVAPLPQSRLEMKGFKRVGGPARRPWRSRAAEFAELLKRTKLQAPHVFNAMAADLNPPPNMQSHQEFLINYIVKTATKTPSPRPNGVSAPRRLLSIMRVFEPLLQAAETGWIERRGDELSVKEFQKFVEAGWARERIMLKRDSDVLRAQRPVSG